MATLVFISIGYRGTNSWPTMIMLPMSPGMTKAQFEEQVLASDFWPNGMGFINDLNTDEFVAIFEVEAGKPTRLECMHDCNVSLPPGMMAYHRYADFIANKGW